MTPEEEQKLREEIAQSIELFMKEEVGNPMPSIFSLVWIKKCADRARGIA
jgi:hypothetical protein